MFFFFCYDLNDILPEWATSIIFLFRLGVEAVFLYFCVWFGLLSSVTWFNTLNNSWGCRSTGSNCIIIMENFVSLKNPYHIFLSHLSTSASTSCSFLQREHKNFQLTCVTSCNTYNFGVLSTFHTKVATPPCVTSRVTSNFILELDESLSERNCMKYSHLQLSGKLNTRWLKTIPICQYIILESYTTILIDSYVILIYSKAEYFNRICVLVAILVRWHCDGKNDQNWNIFLFHTVWNHPFLYFSCCNSSNN